MRPALLFLRLVPRNALSRLTGAVLRGPLPRPVHRGAIHWFCRHYGVEVEEAEKPLSDYPTFNAFFTRALKPGARPVAEGDVLVSPCDGTLGASGVVSSARAVQAKGRLYSTERLLGDASLAARFEGGTFVTIYLAPFNYHRVHAPVSGAIREARHLPGTLWPVNPPAVERIEDLFAINERLVTVLETEFGWVAVVMVGATCVGRIRMRYDDLLTNSGRSHGHRVYDPPLPIEKGAELGAFEMGSTVLLFLEKGRFEGENLVPGRVVRMGEALGRLRRAVDGDGEPVARMR